MVDTIRRHKGAASSYILLILFVASSYVLFMFFTGALSPNQNIPINTQDKNIETLGDAVGDLESSKITLVESEELPDPTKIAYLESYNDFRHVAMEMKTVYLFANEDACNLYVLKDGTYYTYRIQKWEKLRIQNITCKNQGPGWLLTLTLRNVGNLPLTITKIKIAGEEMPSTNFGVDYYVPLAVSTDLSSNYMFRSKEVLTTTLRISSYYRYLSPGKPCEIKFITASGSVITKMVNLSSGS